MATVTFAFPPFNKVDCTPVTRVNLSGVPQSESYVGLLHPSLQTALDSLVAYSRWVNEVVLPIAFAWIEEHKVDVYAGVPEDQRSDVGHAIALAYRLLMSNDPYRNYLVVRRTEIEKNFAAGSFQMTKLNPSWHQISEQIRLHIEDTFNEHPELSTDPVIAPEEPVGV